MGLVVVCHRVDAPVPLVLNSLTVALDKKDLMVRVWVWAQNFVY